MNYRAPTRVVYHTQERTPTLFELIREIFALVQFLFDFLVQFPLYVLEKVGINVIPNFIALNIPLCSICICASFLGVSSSLGIALGVGLGVGLNCAQTQYINYTYNSTILTTTINMTSNMTG